MTRCYTYVPVSKIQSSFKHNMSAPSALEYVRKSNNVVKLSDFLEKNQADGAVVKVEEEVEKVAPPEKFNSFIPPKGEDISGLELANNLVKTVGGQWFRAAPRKALPLPFAVNKSYSWNQSLQMGRPDKAMFNWLCFRPSTRPHANYALSTVRTNNTRRSQLTRLMEQMPTNEFKVSPSNKVQARVAEMLPFRLSAEQYSAMEDVDMKIDNMAFDMINLDANAGLPYMFECVGNMSVNVGGVTRLALAYSKEKVSVPLNEKPIPVLQHALGVARSFYHQVVSKMQDVPSIPQILEKFFDTRPELNTFFAKRKFEILDRAEWNKKSRTYYVQPLPMRLFCKWAWHPVEVGVQNFLHNQESVSMYHYSHFRGGATALVKALTTWIEAHSKVPVKGYHFKSLVYGDDNLWVLLNPETGEVIICSFDVRAMDLHTLSGVVLRAAVWVKTALPSIPDERLFSFVSAMYMGFHKNLLVGGSSVVRVDNSWNSGIPGTTMGNIHSSAQMAANSEEVFEKCDRAASFGDILVKVFGSIERDLHFTFKDVSGFSGLTQRQLEQQFPANVQVLSSWREVERVGIRVPFLGNVVRPYTEEGLGVRYYSAPADTVKFGASLVNVGGEINHVVQMQRLLGVTYAGAWTDENLYPVMCEMYSGYAKSHHCEVDLRFEDEEYESPAEVENFTSTLKSLGRTSKDGLPSVEFMRDFNILSEEEFRAKWALSSGDSELLVQSAHSGKDEEMDDFAALAVNLARVGFKPAQKTGDRLKVAQEEAGVGVGKGQAEFNLNSVPVRTYEKTAIGHPALSKEERVAKAKARVESIRAQFLKRMEMSFATDSKVDFRGSTRGEISDYLRQQMEEAQDDEDQDRYNQADHARSRMEDEMERLDNLAEELERRYEDEDRVWKDAENDVEELDDPFLKNAYNAIMFGRDG